MNLTLNAREQALLSKTLRILASPFEHERLDDWIRVTAESARKVLGAERKAFFSIPGRSAVYHPGYSEKDVAEYEHYQPLLSSSAMFSRTARLKVATRRQAYGPHYETVMGGPYGREYLPRIRAFDSLSISVPLREIPRKQADTIQLIFCTTSPERTFTDRQVAIACLLHPALESGIHTYRRLAAAQDQMTDLLDSGGGACALYTVDGNLLHCTPALEDVLLREPRREDLMAYVRWVALSFGSPDADVTCRALKARFNGALGGYTLSPSCVRKLLDRPAILISVSPPRRRRVLPTAKALAERFGLTPQEARVALHLADRRTNREIAKALCISIHTARHHVRHTLEKLDVPRRDVGSCIAAQYYRVLHA